MLLYGKISCTYGIHDIISPYRIGKRQAQRKKRSVTYITGYVPIVEGTVKWRHMGCICLMAGLFTTV
jgi:hypothetical protein